jgi:hypothetical protein
VSSFRAAMFKHPTHEAMLMFGELSVAVAHRELGVIIRFLIPKESRVAHGFSPA